MKCSKDGFKDASHKTIRIIELLAVIYEFIIFGPESRPPIKRKHTSLALAVGTVQVPLLETLQHDNMAIYFLFKTRTSFLTFIMTPKIEIFFNEKAPWEMLYMVERWTFVGSMIQRLQIVRIYGLKKCEQAK